MDLRTLEITQDLPHGKETAAIHFPAGATLVIDGAMGQDAEGHPFGTHTYTFPLDEVAKIKLEPFKEGS
jgi:hypothetical protein